MKVISISKKNLPNEEHYQFFSIVRKIFESILLVANFCSPELWAKFLEQYNILNTALEPLVKSPLTDKIEESDKKRDETLKGFRNAVKAFLSNKDLAKRDAATLITLLFKKYGKYGKIVKLNYDRETAAINNLVEDLRNKYFDSVELLGIVQWVDDLDDDNQECNNLIEQRDRENSEKPKIKAPEARKAIDDCYTELLTTLEAYMINNPGYGFEPLIDELNSTITRYKIRMAQKEGRAKAAKGKDEQSTEDTMLDTLINTEKIAVIEQNEQNANQQNQHHQSHWTPIPPRDNDKPFEK